MVFTDANCMYEQDALLKLSRHFSNPEIGCVVGKLSYVERHLTSVGKGEGIYWKYEEKIKILESKLSSVLVGNGAIFAIRKELFSHLYPEVANDFQLPVEIGSRGYGIVYDQEAVTIERSTIFWQEEFQRKVRIVLRGLTGFSILKNIGVSTLHGRLKTYETIKKCLKLPAPVRADNRWGHSEHR